MAAGREGVDHWSVAAIGSRCSTYGSKLCIVSFPSALGLTVKQAQKHLGQRGILIRDASLFEGLNEQYCRVAIRLREDNERLIEGLRQTMAALAQNRGQSHD